MKKLLIYPLLIILSFALIFTLASCSSGGGAADGKISKKLDELFESANKNENYWYNIEPEKAKELYLRYFAIYPEKFEEFYNSKKQNGENSGGYSISTPRIKFDVVMPDGEVREYSHDMYTGETRCFTIYEKNWNTQEYRYLEFDGFYTEKTEGAQIFDSEMNNVAAVSAESLAKSTLYVRMIPAEVKVKLNLSGGELIDADTEFTMRIGDSISAILNSTPEKNGYTFVGWSYSTTASSEADGFITPEELLSGEDVLITEDFKFNNELDYKNDYANGTPAGIFYKQYSIEISARYSPIMHKITCLYEDGSVFSETEYAYGTKIYQNTIDKISFYDYKGWSLAYGSNTLFDWFEVDGDITLYPVKAMKKRVVIYVGDLLVIEQEVSDAYPFVLSAVVPTGYKFDGWYLDSGYTVKVDGTAITFDDIKDAYYLKLVKKEES